MGGATEVHELHSEAVDDDFTVSVARCGGDPRATLLLTDADGLFGLTVDTVRLMQLTGLVPSMLIVGIGYPGAETIRDTIQIRARDLTPTHSPVFHRSGGGSEFATFLATQLRPWLAERFPSAAGDITYFGHSLGGLFGTHVMHTRPELFDRYILSSPSLWWDSEVVFGIEQTWFDHHDDLDAIVYFGIGGLETDAGRRIESANLPDDHPAKPPAAYLDMVADMGRFVDQLRSRDYQSLSVESVVIADEFHVTVPAIVLSRALRWFGTLGQLDDQPGR